MHKQRPSNKSVWDAKSVWLGPGGALPRDEGSGKFPGTLEPIGGGVGGERRQDLALETDFHISDETCQSLIFGLDRNWGRWMTDHIGEP